MKRLKRTLIKAIIETPRDSAEALAWRLHSNIYVPSSPIDEAQFFAEVLDKLKLTISGLAEKLHRSESYIKSRLKILSYPEEIQKALINKKISLGVAEQLAKVKHPEIRKELVRRAVVDGVSEGRAKIWAQEYSKVEQGVPPPPPEEIQEKIKEMDEYLMTPCEVCGGKVRVGDLSSISGHTACIEELRAAIEYEKQHRQEIENEKNEKEGNNDNS